MQKRTGKKPNPIWADIERWQMELAQELGLIEEVRLEQMSTYPTPVLRSQHCRLGKGSMRIAKQPKP